MIFSDKTLLLMGGGAFAQDLVKYANETGFKMIAVGEDPSKLELIADETYRIDTQDIDSLERLIREKNIDGIFVGTTEVNIPPAIELAKRTGAHFYATKEQWNVLADKVKFKQLLQKFDIGTIPEYTNNEDIQYPALVKPVDSSGARGISLCHSKEDLKQACEYALSYSPGKQYVIERFMDGMDDTFIRYHFQDGNYSISSSYDRHVNMSQGGFGGIGIAYIHPSKHLGAYIEKIDQQMQKAFKAVQLKDGVITLQAFVDKDENFFFYEAGYRLGGSQSYIFTDLLNRSNSLHYIINYALTGKMADYNISERDNPWVKKPCCNLYIALKPGKICEFNGVEAVRAIPGVLNVTEMCGKGTTIEKTGSLSQVCIRMHLYAENIISMKELLSRVYDTLDIRDENGEDMILEKYCYEEVNNES